MREFVKVQPHGFWTGETARRLRGRPNQRILWDYLVTGTMATPIGLYYAPVTTICYETGLSAIEFKAAMEWLSTKDGCAHFDHHVELAFIPTMALIQYGERMSPKDKNISWILRELKKFRGHPFALKWVALYNERFNLGISDPLQATGGVRLHGSPFEGASSVTEIEGPSERPEGPSKGLPVDGMGHPGFASKTETEIENSSLSPAGAPARSTGYANSDGLSPPRGSYRPIPVGIISEQYLRVYDAYPRKDGKWKAAEVFHELAAEYGGEQPLADEILSAFAGGMLKRAPYAGKHDTRPMLETVLRERRWRDDPSAPDDDVVRPVNGGGVRPRASGYAQPPLGGTNYLEGLPQRAKGGAS